MAATSSSTAASADAVAATAADVKFSVEILDLVKTAQAQNGLRHNDYDRYAQYCTRRLHKIRHAKAVNFTYGKTKKFAGKTLTAEMVTDSRHLQIPLMNAERAWAQSQKLKQDVSDGTGTSAEQHHAKQRLRKASKWADELEALAAEKGDAKTAVEAQAYAAWMRGTLAMVEEKYDVALANVSTAKKIYESLATASSRRTKELYQSRVDELAPTERFCRYTLTRAAKASGTSSAALSADAASSDLSDKLAAAIGGGSGGAAGVAAGEGAAAGSLAIAADGGSVFWRGTHLAVSNDKLKAALRSVASKAQHIAVEGLAGAASSAAAGGAGATPSPSGAGVTAVRAGDASPDSASSEAPYLELQSRLDDAGRIASTEAQRALKDGKAALAADYSALEQFTRFAKQRYVLDRALGVQVKTAVAALQTAITTPVAGSVDAAGAKGGKGKATKARAAGGEEADASTAGGASGGASRAAVPSFTAANPWLAAQGGVSTQQALATPGAPSTSTTTVPTVGFGSAVEGINPAAASAANNVAAIYARAIRACEDMAGLAGDAAASAAAEGGAGSSSASSASSSTAGLAPDALLTTAIATRRSVLTAWRAYYVALGYLFNKRFADATVMLHRAQTRAEDTLDGLRALPAGLKPRELPARPIPLGADEETSTASPAAAFSGLSTSDVESLNELLDQVAQQNVALQATALLEQLAYKTRLDGSFAAVYKTSAFGTSGAAKPPLPSSLVRAPRPSNLIERLAPDAAIEAPADAGVVAAWPPQPVAVPFKPILLDLALNAFEYPDFSHKLPAAERAAPAPAPAPAPVASAGGGGAASGGAAKAPAPAPAPAPASSGGGGGLLGWLTGR